VNSTALPYSRAFVTGAAGFIGSTLVDRLLALGIQVVGYDNMSTGFEEFVAAASRHPGYNLHRADLLDTARLTAAMAGADIVFHLAANADVRFGLEHPSKDLQQNTIATFKVLEAMRANRVADIVFPSTGSVYGEATIFPTPESAPFPIQTSLYGASKLAGESLIAAYCEGFGMRAWIFRFVSILGERYTHGHVLDFYRKLLAQPDLLHVLGDGRQRKSYLYVQDCVDAIFHAVRHSRGKVNLFNLGTSDYCEVNDSIGWITGHLGLHPKIQYAGGERGWIGDNPFIFLDTSRIGALGWRPQLGIQESVVRTLTWLMQNRWVLERCEKESSSGTIVMTETGR
jgi:UDP-glucose 4-epimerase